MEDLRIELRREGAGDEEFLSRLYCDTRRQEVAQWGWPDGQQAQFLKMQFEAQRRAYRATYPGAASEIVRVADADAGRILVAEEPGGMRLVDIALLEEHRNRGVGTALLRGLQRQCELSGVSLRLQVLMGNPARRLYGRLGFEETGADTMYVQMEWHPRTAREGV